MDPLPNRNGIFIKQAVSQLKGTKIYVILNLKQYTLRGKLLKKNTFNMSVNQLILFKLPYSKYFKISFI
jgi:hypothetical protein